MHLHIKLRRDGSGYPPFDAEEVEALEIESHTFKLTSVPSFAFGLAVGDVVRAEHYEGSLWIEELLNASGHSTVRLIPLKENNLDAPAEELRRLGCKITAGAVDGLLTVDVPPSVDFDDLRAYLMTGRESSRWDFSIGVRGDGR